MSNIYRTLFYCAVLAPYVVYAWVNGTGGVFKSRLLAVVYLYIVYVIASQFWSIGGDFEWRLVRYAVIIAVFLAATAFLASQGEYFRDRFFLFLGYAASINAAISFVMFASGTGAEQNQRLLSWLWPDPNSAATVFSVVAIGLCVQSFRHSGRARLAYAFPLVICLAFIGMTSSRTPMATLVAGLVIVAAGNVRRLSRTLIVAVALGVGAIALFAVTSDRWSFRGMLRSLWGYTDVWGHFYALGWERPWFGHGIRNVEKIENPDVAVMTNAHNSFVDSFYFGGAVGFLFLVLICCIAIWVAWRSWSLRRDPLAAALLPCLLLYPYGLPAVLSLFEAVQWWWLHCWLVLGLIAAEEVRNRAFAPPDKVASQPATGVAGHAT